ncbi:hypothetical protein [Comamonas aquatica]|uniref:hypothetical protein n=1 Tax=Comamonas aquatica TaxID=225991 RepID=UPI0031E308A0
MQKYQSIISGTNGSVIRNVPVTVLKEDGSLAEIFLDREGQVPGPNPLATDSRGVFYFYAKNGRYSLRTSVDGITITDADAVLLNDPEEIATAGPIVDAVIRAEAAAQRAEFAVEASGIPDLVSQTQNAVLDANAALQGAQSAAQLADDAKAQAASAKNAAELAQQASDTAKTGAENARSLAEQAADQARVYAESIDPAQFVQKEAGKGLMTEGERTKLSGIAEQATKNAADDALRDRSTHSGTQGMETITGLSAALDARVVETAATGAALLPSGTTAQRPDPTLHPSDLLVRGNTDTGKPEWYNRAKSAWQPFGDAGGELFNYAWHNGPRSSIDVGRVPTDGQQLLLLTHPDVCQAIWDGKQHAVDESVWQADPTKRNCWSRGDGSSWVRVPDLNAAVAGTGKPFYLRGGPTSLGGTSVLDAIRNIEGTMPIISGNKRGNTAIPTGTGALRAFSGGIGHNAAVSEGTSYGLTFDASLSVPTADENRVKTAYGVVTVRVFTEVGNVGALDAGQLATQLGVVDAKAQALDANTGFTIIYPNGGTQASPASVAINSRYVESNPFAGFPIMCSVELSYAGEWSEVKMGGSGSASYGADAGQNNNSSIVLVTGTQYLITASALHYFSGARPGANVTTGLPCRIKVWKLKGGA